MKKVYPQDKLACFIVKNNFGERVLGGGWIDKTVNKNLSTQLTEH